jgi:biotin carboxyl carrier protein
MSRQYTILLDNEEHVVEVISEGDSYLLTFEGTQHHFTPLLNRPPLHTFLVDHSEVLEADIVFDKDRCEINVGGVPYPLEIFDPRHRLISQSDSPGAGAGQGLISAPMPGKVVDVKITQGSKVKAGEAVVIIEAMKMQNELHAPIDGVAQEVCVKAGDTVESGQKLVVVSKGDSK